MAGYCPVFEKMRKWNVQVVAAHARPRRPAYSMRMLMVMAQGIDTSLNSHWRLLEVYLSAGVGL